MGGERAAKLAGCDCRLSLRRSGARAYHGACTDYRGCHTRAFANPRAVANQHANHCTDRYRLAHADAYAHTRANGNAYPHGRPGNTGVEWHG